MSTQPWNNWYKKAAWIKRAKLQLAVDPICTMCLRLGKVRAAEVADHIVPHRGDPELFWFGKLQSLCWSHHSASKAQIEKQGYSNEIGEDGYPIDPNHPFNKESA